MVVSIRRFLFVLIVSMNSAYAIKPSSPISVEFQLDTSNASIAIATVTIRSHSALTDGSLSIQIPNAATKVDGDLAWKGSLDASQQIVLKAKYDIGNLKDRSEPWLASVTGTVNGIKFTRKTQTNLPDGLKRSPRTNGDLRIKAGAIEFGSE